MVFKKLFNKATRQRNPRILSKPPTTGLKAEDMPPQKPSTIVGTSHSEEQWPKTWTSSSNFLEEEEEEEEKEDVA